MIPRFYTNHLILLGGADVRTDLFRVAFRAQHEKFNFIFNRLCNLVLHSKQTYPTLFTATGTHPGIHSQLHNFSFRLFLLLVLLPVIPPIFLIVCLCANPLFSNASSSLLCFVSKVKAHSLLNMQPPLFWLQDLHTAS